MHGAGSYYKMCKNDKIMQCKPSTTFKQGTQNKIIVEPVKPQHQSK